MMLLYMRKYIYILLIFKHRWPNGLLREDLSKWRQDCWATEQLAGKIYPYDVRFDPQDVIKVVKVMYCPKCDKNMHLHLQEIMQESYRILL